MGTVSRLGNKTVGGEMRLFIAVDFNSRKDSLADIIASFKGHSIKGNFTRPENLHQPLFLGQTNNLADKGGMDEVLASAYLALRVLAADVVENALIGVEDNKMLQNIYELSSSLTSKGLSLKKKI